MRTNRKYGYIPDLKDFRDHKFKLAIPIPLPESVDLRPGLPPVYDQGSLGSCTANAIAAAIDFERNRQGQPFMNPSRLFIYYNERVIEGTVASDGGAMIRDGIKSVADMGVCAETEWPYDPTQFAADPPAGDYTDALLNKALVYSTVSPALMEMLQCLAGGYPIIFGFSVYESFESPDVAATGIVPMPDLSESMVGGHAVLACGYDQTRRAFLVRNSWGPGWGMAGYFWLPYEYAASPDLADDRWCLKLME